MTDPTHAQDDQLFEHLTQCEQRIGYQFRDKQLLREALSHASGVPDRLLSNERLEFLGDAILGAVVSELLFHRFPDCLEGELTRLKSIVVSRAVCAKISKQIGLGDFLLLGRGVNPQAIPTSLLADAFESLVAAIYLDGGLEAARSFITRHVLPEIDAAASDELGGDYKSQLQQVSQRALGVTPVYELVEERGPDHCKWFKMAARIGDQTFPGAWGRSKKEAEQRAARNALAMLSHQEVEASKEPPGDSSC